MTIRDPRESWKWRTRRLVCALSLVALAGPSWVSAQSLEEAKTLLRSHDSEDVATGIQTLGLLGTATALPPLEQRIRRGLPPQLLELAVATMAAIGSPAAAPTLISLTAHRRPEIRTRSCEALGALKAKDGHQALVHRLGDEDPRVRTAAARALGELGNPIALPALFQALGKGSTNAATAIGRLTPNREVPRLLRYLDEMAFRSLAPALGEILRRADIEAAVKVRMVRRLAALGTNEVAEFLKEVLTGTQSPLDRQVSHALGRAILEIEK